MTADLPKVGLPGEDIDKLTRIEITNADKGSVTLEKKGDAWEVAKPVSAKANASNVKSLLDNLKELQAKETIDRTKNLYAQYDLDDNKAVHVMAFKGEEKAFDAYFGKSGSRGQLVRLEGKDGVFTVKGYQGYQYTRELKNWRETSILKFEDDNVLEATVTNKNGKFSFSKNGDKWTGSKGPGEWKEFDESKLKDMLRAYKSLNAEDFGDAKSDAGLDKPEENGGIVTLRLKDNGGTITINVGKVAKGSSRFATKVGGTAPFMSCRLGQPIGPWERPRSGRSQIRKRTTRMRRPRQSPRITATKKRTNRVIASAVDL